MSEAGVYFVTVSYHPYHVTGCEFPKGSKLSKTFFPTISSYFMNVPYTWDNPASRPWLPNSTYLPPSIKGNREAVCTDM